MHSIAHRLRIVQLPAVHKQLCTYMLNTERSKDRRARRVEKQALPTCVSQRPLQRKLRGASAAAIQAVHSLGAGVVEQHEAVATCRVQRAWCAGVN
jgi:hypothetical protein